MPPRSKFKTLTALLLAALLAACQARIPKEALQLSGSSAQKRSLQTRRFDGIAERDLLAACAGVLQDLGFNLDKSETPLGLLVASKDRSAVQGGQVVASVIFSVLFGTKLEYDQAQNIRVSLAVTPAKPNAPPAKDAKSSWKVRVTFQRTVTDNSEKISRQESIEDPKIHAEFFQRLSKSVFLEAQKI